MAECFKCGISDRKTTLFTAVSKNGIVKVCAKCASTENMPVVNKKEIPESFNDSGINDFFVEKHEKGKMVYDRLSRMAGIKPRDTALREKEELMRKQDEELRKLVERSVKEKEIVEKREDLIDNFHWVIMRARRFKHLTQKELAKEIGEPELLIKLAEEGKIALKNERLLDKLEDYLNIKLRKKQKESLVGTLEDFEEFSFDSVTNKNMTISELKEMAEKKEAEKEESKKDEEDKPLTKEEIDRILYGRE
jgi:ribosome-binding protein aMBF1 (putative translation factor)